MKARLSMVASALLVAMSLAGIATAAEPPENGLFIDKWPSGKKKISCWYKKGKINGSYKEYGENGKLIKQCTYRMGSIEGLYREFYPSGKGKLVAQYKGGKINGRVVEFDEKGKVMRDEVFVGGTLKFSRSVEEIAAAIKEIKKGIPRTGTKFDEPASHEGEMKPGKLSQATLDEALAHLKAYRYLAGVPYKDIVLNGRYNSESQHASVLLAVLGRLDHKPRRPGSVPEEFYKTGYAGTSHSNLAMGRTRLTQSLNSWMNDSDPSNIDRIGHRRWCINPSMKQTGFGIYGKFSAVWALDGSRKPKPKFDHIPWPGKGYHPAEYFGKDWAWNVSLNPKKYAKPVKGVAKATVWKLDDQFKNKGEPLKLNYYNVNLDGFGVPYCIIFRPDGISLTPGSRYRVQIDGIKPKRGKEPAAIRYVVEFFRLPR